MNPCFDLDLAKDYKSEPQRIRVMSEAWVAKYIFCPACGSTLQRHKNNHKAADFYCQNCRKEFELKSSGRKFGKKITDGAYDTMRERIKSGRSPNFFFLHYNFAADCYYVENFFCVPKQFFTCRYIEKRKPLGAGAKRADWIGCNILIDRLPESGKIFYIQDKKRFVDTDIVKAFNKVSFLKNQPANATGWLLDVMKHIDLLEEKRFTLKQLYTAAADILRQQHPENNHIRAKIRQQLRILRDKGYLQFRGRGYYSLTQ